MTTHKKVIRKRARRTAKKVGHKIYTRKRVHRIRVHGGTKRRRERTTERSVRARINRNNANENENENKNKNMNNENENENENMNEHANEVPRCIPKREKHTNIRILAIPANMVRNLEYKYPVDKSLCVLPTSLKMLRNDGKDRSYQEAQYEAFQSIFAYIMSANPNRKINEAPVSPYEILCDNHCIRLIASADNPIQKIKGKGSGARKEEMKKEKIIFFPKTKETHYKALINGSVRDPYKYYQIYKSQGFCQMFAFLLAVNSDINLEKEDIPGFKFVNQRRIVDITKDKPDFSNFIKLVQNSQECFKRSLEYIAEENVYEAFENEFDLLYTTIHDDTTGLTKSQHFGLKDGTPFKTYLSDFQKINNVFSSVAYYIYDQQMNITEDERDILWKNLPAIHPSI